MVVLAFLQIRTQASKMPCILRLNLVSATYQLRYYNTSLAPSTTISCLDYCSNLMTDFPLYLFSKGSQSDPGKSKVRSTHSFDQNHSLTPWTWLKQHLPSEVSKPLSLNMLLQDTLSLFPALLISTVLV